MKKKNMNSSNEDRIMRNSHIDANVMALQISNEKNNMKSKIKHNSSKNNSFSVVN
jgi:hypothetical protein